MMCVFVFIYSFMHVHETMLDATIPDMSRKDPAVHGHNELKKSAHRPLFLVML